MSEPKMISGSEAIKQPRRASYFQRLNTFFLHYKSITTSNWLDVLFRFYGDYPVIELEEPLNYPFLSTAVLSYREILKWVNRAGNALLKLGIKKGDRVLIVPSNRIELALSNFACNKISAIAVPVNFMFTAKELEYIIRDCAPKVIITDQEVYFKNFSDQKPLGIEHLLVLEESPPPGASSLAELMKEADETLSPNPQIRLNEVAQIFYTSGTTGFPKGALITHLNLLYFIRAFSALGSLYPWRGKELLITSLPLAHIMGMMLLVIRLCGKTRWYFINRFVPERVVELLEQKKATAFIGVPAMFARLKELGLEKRDLSSVLLWGSAADRMPPELIEYFQKLGYRRYIFPVFVEMYGQVETSGAITVKATFPFRKPRTGSVGMLFPWVKFRVMKEDNTLARVGEVGELEVKGPMVSPGYWNQSLPNKKPLEDSWHQTGDLVRRGRFRMLTFVDRKSERIKCGGYSVFPAEVEQELLAHPLVKESAVLGIPDPRKGQIPVAVVTLKANGVLSPEALLEWARKNIARYKCPRQIKIIEEMPRGSTQKLLKRELIKLFLPEKATDSLKEEKNEEGN